MEPFGTDMAFVRFLIGVGFTVGDQGGNAVEGFIAHLDWKRKWLNVVTSNIAKDSC